MEKQGLITNISAGLLMLGLAVTADAALVGRLAATPGGTDYQAYYDEDTDLTWLADANAVGNDISWEFANDWVAGLNIDGVTGWRLPTTMQPDASCMVQSNDPSFPIQQGAGRGCTGSEMGYLFKKQKIRAATPGPFSNVQSARYWSGTEFAPNTTLGWNFNFNTGYQAARDKSADLFVWAVQSGDVSTAPVLPVPAAVWLFGSGLLGLIGVARRKRV